jgi:hypothetical protein
MSQSDSGQTVTAAATLYRASPNWMALKQIFLLFWIFANARATVLLKVLTLQQLNSKNIW